MQMAEYLLVFDLDKIHDYVFATGRLKEIRGGSALMSEATEEATVLSLLSGYSPRAVYVGGGAGKVLITAKDGEHARRAADLLERSVREKTVTGSMTAVTVPADGEFGAAVTEGDWHLRRRKASKSFALQLGMAPVTEFCQSCRMFPAAKRMDERDLCSSCHAKRRKADDLKNGMENVAFWRQHFLGGEFWRAIQERYPQNQTEWQCAGVAVEDLSDLAALGSPPNYIGFIYCDGNRVGEHLNRLGGSLEEYARFSRLVNGAVVGAAAEALAEAYPKPRQGKMPFDVVLVGGDDLVLITTADAAIEVAAEFCKRFQERTRSGGHEVAMSAGVVLAQAHQPILQVQQRAKELLSSAKGFGDVQRRSRGNQGEVGAVDFLVCSSSTLDSLSALRAVEYGFRSAARDRQDVQHWRHRRPYTVEELELVVKWVRSIRHGDPSKRVPPVPRNKLNDMYHAFFQSQRAKIEFDLLVIAGRLRQEHRTWILGEIPEALLGTIQEFWQERPGARASDGVEYHAVLPDLIELYEFVGARRGEAGS